MGIAGLRAQLRQAVRGTFGYVAVYIPKAVDVPASSEISVRYHSKFSMSTDDMTHDHSGARFVVGLSSVLFDKQELAEHGIVPKPGNYLLLVELGIKLKLNAELPDDGQNNTLRYVVEQVKNA